jgi:hypothetical protein
MRRLGGLFASLKQRDGSGVVPALFTQSGCRGGVAFRFAVFAEAIPQNIDPTEGDDEGATGQPEEKQDLQDMDRGYA